MKEIKLLTKKNGTQIKKVDNSYKQEIFGKDLDKFHYIKRMLFVKYGKHLASFVDERFYKMPHIIIREIAENSLICAYTEEEIYSSSSTHLVIQKDENMSLKYILGILNSKLMGWYHYNTSPKAKKGIFPKVLVNDINNFPIAGNSFDIQKPLIDLVDQITKSKLLGEKTVELETKIDHLVYQLYNLTEEEIAIVEQATKN